MTYKEQVTDFVKTKKVYDGDSSIIYKLEDGRLYKEMKPLVHSVLQRTGIDLEKKLLSTNASSIGEIVCPISLVYNEHFCKGYTMAEVKGNTLTKYEEELSLFEKSNLELYFSLYSKIEDIVKRANDSGIVLPDLCTIDNIMILPNKEIKLIDFDGMQFGDDDKSFVFSDNLKHIRSYINSTKFMKKEAHFTKELDITSLTILLFLLVFNVDLNKVGAFEPFTKTKITLKDVFELIGINDPIFMKKVEENLSLKTKGSYLGSDLYRIMKNYQMIAIPSPIEGMCLKKLFRR